MQKGTEIESKWSLETDKEGGSDKWFTEDQDPCVSEE